MKILPVHPTMKTVLGEPAVVHRGESYPSVLILAEEEGYVTGDVVHVTKGKVLDIPRTELMAGKEAKISIPGSPDAAGGYRIRLQLWNTAKLCQYEAFHFTVTENELQEKEKYPAFQIDDKNHLVYLPDYRGNKIPDFSNCGYGGGGIRIPYAPIEVVLESNGMDDEERIQAAINAVSELPEDAQGFRGAVLLKRGFYKIKGTLRIMASGVVLRGEGQGEDGTILFAAGKEKRTLLRVGGTEGPVEIPGTAVGITDCYVPVGARSFHVSSTEGFKTGDTVMVRRKGNQQWIHEIGMDRITPRHPDRPAGTRQWEPFNLEFDRVITEINRDCITVDAPITCAIDQQWGGGEIFKYTDPERIQQVGIENLRAVSEFDESIIGDRKGMKYYADEEHADRFVVLNHVKNAWVRDCTALHFSYCLAETGKNSKWITIQDCSCLDMVSLIDGGRRYPYHYTGQLALTLRSYADTGRHSFVLGSRVPGPNVFLLCKSTTDYANSEPHHRWSVGGLYDNVKSPIAIQDRQYMGSGHGWSGANYVTWNTEGGLVVQKPPTAQNWAVGHVGDKMKGAFEPREDGFWMSYGSHVNPESLYLQQLLERLGKQGAQNIVQE